MPAGPKKIRERPRAGRAGGPAGKRSVFVAVSLDGFIARENGGLDWLVGPGGAADEDYGYKAFMGRVDALVMGRNTFEKVLAFGEWPYGDTPVIVLTRSPMRVPRRLAGRVEVMAGPPAKIVERLGRRGLRRLYVDGGRTVQGFLASGLIDELTITRIPILLGRGLALFGPLPGDMRLRHVKTRAFASGFVQSLYEVIRRPEPRKARPLTRTGPQASGSQTRRPQ